MISGRGDPQRGPLYMHATRTLFLTLFCKAYNTIIVIYSCHAATGFSCGRGDLSRFWVPVGQFGLILTSVLTQIFASGEVPGTTYFEIGVG